MFASTWVRRRRIRRLSRIRWQRQLGFAAAQPRTERTGANGFPMNIHQSRRAHERALREGCPSTGEECPGLFPRWRESW